jgi:hypothetical protein
MGAVRICRRLANRRLIQAFVTGPNLHRFGPFGVWRLAVTGRVIPQSPGMCGACSFTGALARLRMRMLSTSTPSENAMAKYT